MTLVDFHCHLADAGGYESLPQTSTLFEAAPSVIAVTNRPSEWRAMQTVSRRGVVWAIGLHPALSHRQADVDMVLELLPRADAIGEVGLDYSSQAKQPRGAQRRALAAILGHRAAKRRLVTLHSRGATSDVVSALEDHPAPGAVLHWFLGSERDIDRAIDVDVFFSVNEAMLNSENARRVINCLPPNRVLLETDAPFGGARRRKISPGDFRRVIEGLAMQWARSTTDVVDLVEKNQVAILNRVERPTAL